MQVKDTPRVPERLVELNKALGNVWAIAWPWDELPSTAENADASAVTHRQPQKATLEEIAWSDETVQRFARWLDYRSERLNERMATSSDDYRILDDLTGVHQSKGGGEGSSWGPVLQLLKDRGLVHYHWKENPDYRPDLLPFAQDMTSIPRYQVFYLPKDVALQYLSLCADRLAQLGKRDVVTDQRQFADTSSRATSSYVGRSRLQCSQLLSRRISRQSTRLESLSAGRS